VDRLSFFWLFAARRGNVFDDEDFFTGFDETQFLSCDFLDCGGIFAQPARLFRQVRVYRTVSCERGGQRRVLSAHAQHREQSTIARKRIEHDNGGDEQETEMKDAPVPRSTSCDVSFPADLAWRVGRRHVGRKYTKRVKSTTHE